MHGEYIDYDLNGEMLSKSNYINGKKEGEEYIYRGYYNNSGINYYKNDILVKKIGVHDERFFISYYKDLILGF